MLLDRSRLSSTNDLTNHLDYRNSLYYFSVIEYGEKYVFDINLYTSATCFIKASLFGEYPIENWQVFTFYCLSVGYSFDFGIKYRHSRFTKYSQVTQTKNV